MRLVTLFLLSAFTAFAQLTDGVATSVTRTVTLTADEADFSIVAGPPLGTTQQQVAQIFLDAGVSSLSNSGTALSQNYDYSTNPPTTQTLVLYQFTFSVPTAGLQDAAKIMEALRTSPPALLKSFQYSAALNASQATVDAIDRKSTRLNSRHLVISYAVFCLKKKINKMYTKNHERPTQRH